MSIANTAIDEHHIGHNVRQTTISTYLRVAVLISCHDIGLMTIETYLNVAEQQWSMTAQGVMVTLPGNFFGVYIMNLTSKPVIQPKVMNVASASKTPKCAIYARDNEPWAMGSGSQSSKQHNSNNTVNTVHCEPTQASRGTRG